jgi:hypothetical protein
MNQTEQESYDAGLKEGCRLGEERVKKIANKLRRVADQCEAGGHKKRARMFRALAREFEGWRYK